MTSKLFHRVFEASSNVGRSLLISLFGLVLNYILIHFSVSKTFNAYVYFISYFAFFYCLVNWEGKFYMIKKLSENPINNKALISDLFSSRLLLVFVAVILISFSDFDYKIILIGYIFLKSLTSIFDGLILYNRKNVTAFIFEILLFTTFLLLLFFNIEIVQDFHLLIGLISLEFMKTLYYLYTFREEVTFQFSVKRGIKVLKNSFYFFSVAFAGFAASKSDFYLVGFLMNKNAMSQYFVISSIASLSMIIFATAKSTFSKNIYRFSSEKFEKLEKTLSIVAFMYAVLSTLASYVLIVYLYKIELNFKFISLMFFNIFAFCLLNFKLYRYTKMNKPKQVLLFLIISALLNGLLSLFLINKLQLLGAFLSNTIGLTVNYILLKFYYQYHLKHEI